ncbi:hypothetical protein XENTR_v10018100 [Xenopus tropicalis]|nr:hypothetical protein XENTR_v10018100 [Xenopus tropicalis]
MESQVKVELMVETGIAGDDLAFVQQVMMPKPTDLPTSRRCYVPVLHVIAWCYHWLAYMHAYILAPARWNFEMRSRERCYSPLMLLHPPGVRGMTASQYMAGTDRVMAALKGKNNFNQHDEQYLL